MYENRNRNLDRRPVGRTRAGGECTAGIKRTPLQSIDFPDGYKTVTGLAEVAPGSASGPHTHPGIETGYILEGEVLMIVEGQPDQTLKAGDSFIDSGRASRREEHRQRAAKGSAYSWTVAAGKREVSATLPSERSRRSDEAALRRMLD